MRDARVTNVEKEDPPKHVFLRNEPTVFADDFLCITSISKYLSRLQGSFAGGFVLENEPTGGGIWWGWRPENWKTKPPLGAAKGLRTRSNASLPWRNTKRGKRGRLGQPCLPGEIERMGTGVFFGGSWFRILAMKRVS